MKPDWPGEKEEQILGATRRNKRILHLPTCFDKKWDGLLRKISAPKWTLLPLVTVSHNLESTVLFSSELKRRWIDGRVVLAATLMLIVSLSGCDTAPLPDDPAMQNAAVKDVSPPKVPTMEPQATVVDPQIPTRKEGRVFFPQLGWLEEGAFWEMYASEPEKLPDSLDLYAAHQLQREYEREREAEGEI